MKRINADEVLAKVEKDRKSGVQSEKVTTDKIRYYHSRQKDSVEEVNTKN